MDVLAGEPHLTAVSPQGTLRSSSWQTPPALEQARRDRVCSDRRLWPGPFFRLSGMGNGTFHRCERGAHLPHRTDPDGRTRLPDLGRTDDRDPLAEPGDFTRRRAPALAVRPSPASARAKRVPGGERDGPAGLRQQCFLQRVFQGLAPTIHRLGDPCLRIRYGTGSVYTNSNLDGATQFASDSRIHRRYLAFGARLERLQLGTRDGALDVCFAPYRCDPGVGVHL